MADALAELLLREGAVSAQGLAAAQARQRELGGALDTALLELGLIGEARLAAFLARASGLPVPPPSALLRPDGRAHRLFPARVAERHGLAPFRIEERELSLLATCPVDAAALDEISFMLSLDLVPYAAPEWRVYELRQRLYGAPLPARFEALRGRLAGEPAPGPGSTPPPRGSSPPPRRPAQASRPEQGAGPSQPLRLDLEEARRQVAAAERRDELVSVVLRFAREFLEHAALLVVVRGRLAGHDALGPDPEARARVRSLSVPVGGTGIFRAVLDSGGPYLGPTAPDPVLSAVLQGMGRGAPHTVFLYPVVVRDRPVCVLCADNGEAPVSPRRLGDLLLLAGSLAGAFERLLAAARREPPRAGPPDEVLQGPHEGFWETREPGRADLPPEPAEAPPAAGEVAAGGYEVAAAADALAAVGLDPAEGVARLQATARGSAERSRLVGLLVRRGPEAAAALAATFPGPVDPRAAELGDAVAVEERGPVLQALAALGIVATPWLAPLLADPDPGRRLHAALLLGRIGDPAAFLPLADAAFDAEPAVAAAALEALGSHRRHPDFRPVLERFRRALLEEAPRPLAALRALVRLGDGEAVPRVARLLDGEPGLSQAAAEALEALTARHLGRDPAAWQAFWAEHRGRPRAEWLFEALESADRDTRLAAAEALRAAGPSPVRWFADAPEGERSQAAREWRAWWEASGLEA
ncbi:MAG TPA: HEAT repeat domain-containing protein [Anaeromyxobacteraceae bacterium]